MAVQQRHTFPIADLARIHGNGQRTIQAVHGNRCPVLTRAGDCTCTDVTYRLVRTREAVQR